MRLFNGGCSMQSIARFTAPDVFAGPSRPCFPLRLNRPAWRCGFRAFYWLKPIGSCRWIRQRCIDRIRCGVERSSFLRHRNGGRDRVATTGFPCSYCPTTWNTSGACSGFVEVNMSNPLGPSRAIQYRLNFAPRGRRNPFSFL